MKKVLMFLVIFSFLFVPVKAWGAPIKEEVSVSTVSAEVEEVVVVEIKPVDITVPTEKGDRLTKLLEEQKLSNWWGRDILKIAIRKSVAAGVSPNTLVLLFLFPLVAALVAFSRQVVGVKGFGIITPALLSVAFLSTGGVAGLILLSFIVGVATLGRMLMKKIRVPYLPKLAILIWVVSMAVLFLLLISTGLGLKQLTTVGIFPIMLFVLLAETFIEAQITRSLGTSMWMTVETVTLALIAYKLMSAPWVQSQVLLHPGTSVISILALDFLIGRYKGLRLLEVWRFRKLLSK